MLLKAVLISVPRFVTAATQITAIRPTSITVFDQDRTLIIAAEPID